MAVLVCLVLFLALTGHSTATYCICKDGLSDAQLQKAIDYACGAGADCSGILQAGACYQPNTVKDHCSYAVNSYYQRKGQVAGSCDFASTATTSATLPSTVASGCTYQSTPGTTGTGTGTGTTTPSTTTPSTTPTSTPTTGTTTTIPSTTTGTTPGFGLGPTGSGTGITDPSAGVALKGTNLLFSLSTAFWLAGLVSMWG